MLLESLGKQCMFGNPLGNNECLGIPWETMYVWESRNEKQCALKFASPLICIPTVAALPLRGAFAPIVFSSSAVTGMLFMCAHAKHAAL